MVLVDVVVTDSKDEPVTGLEKKDFEISEDGKRQTMSAMEEHKVIHAKPQKLPPMPPDVYTNFPPLRNEGPVNILLLDSLNTQVSDQSYVRAQLIRYLEAVEPGTRLAVFVLTSQLRMIQSVTTDSAVLLAALNKASGAGPQQSPMMLSPAEIDMNTVGSAEMMSNLVGETEVALTAMAPRGIAYMMQSKLDMRAETTLQALQQLARYLAGIPGRKNLIWFSGSFPVSVFPDLSAAEPFQGARQFGGEVERTATLLTVAQVAIYPVAAEGLVSNAVFEANAARISQTRVVGGGSQDFSDSRDRNANHLSMELLAEDTGGKAFYDTNGLKDALARAIDYGSHYYTLAYTPTNKKMDGGYRRIQLKLTAGKYKVAYRRGYYADKGNDARKEQPGNPLLPLMSRGLPDFSQILYKVRVSPSNPQPSPEAAHAGDNVELKGPCTRYGVDFAVAVDDLAFETTNDGLRSSHLEVMLIAYDRDGKLLNSVVRKHELLFKPQSYAAAQAAGLQLHFDIDVPTDVLAANNVYLHSGIYDVRSRNVGTLEIPLRPLMAPAK